MKIRILAWLSLVVFVTLFNAEANAQTYSVIHYFSGTRTNGSYPLSGVTLKNGVLYGTTHDGGAGCGIVYQMTHSGSDWAFAPIYVFRVGEDSFDGCAPFARVVFGPDGHLYGTTFAGGPIFGLVFELSPPVPAHCPTAASAACYWTQNVLHRFEAGSDGGYPEYGDLVWDQQGNIYGTTSGGIYGGTVFQLTKSGNNWTNTTLYHFDPDTEGFPTNGVILDHNDNLYSTTQGLAFKLAYPGWTESVLQEFGGDLGDLTYAGLIMDNSGNLYGTTNEGGSGGAGTVFELSPVGNTYVAGSTALSEATAVARTHPHHGRGGQSVRHHHLSRKIWRW